MTAIGILMCFTTSMSAGHSLISQSTKIMTSLKTETCLCSSQVTMEATISQLLPLSVPLPACLWLIQKVCFSHARKKKEPKSSWRAPTCLITSTTTFSSVISKRSRMDSNTMPPSPVLQAMVLRSRPSSTSMMMQLRTVSTN